MVLDVAKYQKWIKSQSKLIKFPELINLLSNQKISRLRSKILRVVREQQLLDLSPEVEHHLINFILLIESILCLPSSKKSQFEQEYMEQMKALDNELAEWLREYSVDKEKPLTHFLGWSEMELDELNQLLEHIKYRLV